MAGNKGLSPFNKNKNRAEIERDTQGFTDALVKTVKNDVLAEGVSTFWQQLLGDYEKQTPQKPTGELKPGEDLVLGKKPSSEKRHPQKDKLKNLERVAAGIDYHREIQQAGEITTIREQREIQQALKEIQQELERLVSSSAMLQTEFRAVTTEQAPSKPGKYHLNFFQWMLSVIRIARQKVEDSGAWLTTIKSKKGQRQYWSMFKKHGTSFGLSNERSVATQTG